MTEQVSEQKASAAASGAEATSRFFEDKKVVGTTSKERVNTLASEALAAIHDVIRSNGMTYDEYNALKGWLIQVGQDGEWPLLLDVWVEHVVEDVATQNRQGSKGAIEGPFYIPNAPELEVGGGALPMRGGENGTPMLLHGQVRDVSEQPLPAAKIEIWQADGDGLYSQFAPGLPEWNLRGTVIADEQGNFRVQTVQPAPYQIPTDGSCGKLIAAAGWHAWRPAHLHLKVTSPVHQPLTTQLYFPGDPHNDDDIASAVKPDLMLEVKPAADGSGNEAKYDFVLDPA